MNLVNGSLPLSLFSPIDGIPFWFLLVPYLSLFGGGSV